MKTLVEKSRIGLLLVVFFMIGMLANASSSRFGAFEIKKSQNQMVVNNEKVETYIIQYENLKAPVMVGVYADKKCTHYIVRVEGFEIEYQCKNERFGAAFVNDKYATVNMTAVQKNLNLDNFRYQKVISTGEKSETYKLNLIGSYLPEIYKAG